MIKIKAFKSFNLNFKLKCFGNYTFEISNNLVGTEN